MAEDERLDVRSESPLTCVRAADVWSLSGDFRRAVPGGGRGHRAVARLIAAQLEAERPDILARVRFDVADGELEVTSARRDDIVEVADILAHLMAGSIGPVDVPMRSAHSNVVPLARSQPMHDADDVYDIA